MNCVAELEKVKPAITREQESSLYKFLIKQTENDAFRYQSIAKKIQRAADGTAIEWELNIVNDWLGAMQDELTAIEARTIVFTPRRNLFAEARNGHAGNPNYQAYLDTLEQDELDLIENNVGFLCWFSARRAEQPNGVNPVWLRNWADNNLSDRVKSIRGLI